MQIVHLFPAILGQKQGETPRAKPKQYYRGYDPGRKTNAKYLTDQEVLEMRWLYEFKGWSYQRLELLYKDLPKDYIRSVLRYTVRSSSRLFPDSDSFPSNHLPTPRGKS